MKFIPVFILVSLLTSAISQASQHNLDFELLQDSAPKGWIVTGDKEYYSHSLDNHIVQHGKYAASLSHNGGPTGFTAWSYIIPASFQGNKITLKGYVKTENVSEGWAGLWLRIDPGVGFNNMADRGIKGTVDWQEYEITLPLKPQDAQNVVVGGLLVGKGKAWFDNLRVYIDDKPINLAPQLAPAKALSDKEFDNGSNITAAQLKNVAKDDLALMAKVWGFLKYHHPAVASGDYNWDYELFRVLPNYLQSKTSKTRDSVLLTWIDSFGAVSPCTACKTTNESAFLKPDLSWLKQHNLSSELRKKLSYLYKNRSQGSHFYIGRNSAGNPKFKNENAYLAAPYPDAGFRLLALYKYWNMIHYFFPYKHLIQKDWHQVLTEHMNKFIEANDELQYEIATLLLIGEVKDTHANLWGGRNKIEENRGNFYPPVFTQMIEGKLVVTDFYTKTKQLNKEMSYAVGLNIGDVITHVGGVAIEELIVERLPYHPASNYPTQLRDIAPDLLRSNQKTLDINIIRNNKNIAKTLSLFDKKDLDFFRWYRKDKDGTSFKLLDNNIGYVTLKNIKKTDIAKIKEKFKNTQGIIIDIRNYPSTFVPYTLGTFFVDEETPFVKFTEANFNNPGEFNFTKPLTIKNSEPGYAGKLVVLVNEYTQSQAEYTSMAFRAGINTTIIGSTTAGADGNGSMIYLPGGLKSMISGIGIYYPDGTETQQIGIVPDIEILPTIAGIKAGKDELLDKAIEFITVNKK